MKRDCVTVTRDDVNDVSMMPCRLARTSGRLAVSMGAVISADMWSRLVVASSYISSLEVGIHVMVHDLCLMTGYYIPWLHRIYQEKLAARYSTRLPNFTP